MASKAVGYYISVEKKTVKGNRTKWDYEYQSPVYQTKQLALKFAYLHLPSTRFGFLMRAHEDADDDEVKGCAHWSRRANGQHLVFDDEWYVWSDGDDGYRYDVTDKGTLTRKR